MIMLAIRNLFYNWRGNLALLFGVAVGAAVLTGALFVGDSLKQSLKEKALRQSNGVTASFTGERLLDDRLAAKLGAVPALVLRGTLRNETDGSIARVTVYGLDDAGVKALNLPAVPEWNDDAKLAAILSSSLAATLQAKELSRLQLSVQQVSVLPKSSLLGRRKLQDQTQSLGLTVRKVLPPEAAANDFTLMPGPEQPLNLYVPLRYLQDRLGLISKDEEKNSRVNAMFAFGPAAESLNETLNRELTPADWGLMIHVPPGTDYISVESHRLVIPNQQVKEIVKVAEKLKMKAEPTTVYLTNWIASPANLFSPNQYSRIPYSIVAALNPQAASPLGPFLPAGLKQLRDDEIVLTDWPQSPLAGLKPGASVALTYFQPEIERGEVEATAVFRLAGTIPLQDQRWLTPPFPGITDKLKIGDWKPPFDLDLSRIKPGDVNEKYWEQYRTAPKAYITRAAGEKLFASRFGVTTSIRIAPKDRIGDFTKAVSQELDAAALGIQFNDTSAALAKASVGGTDFGMLFLGFSFFLILAALVLVGLFVRLGVERRARDIGSLLAIGYTPKRVRNSLIMEALMVSIPGAMLGVLVAAAYSRGLINVIADLWPDGSVRAILKPHESIASLFLGSSAAIVMSLLAVFVAVRGLVKLPIPMLLKGRTELVELESITAKKRKRLVVFAVLAVLLGIAAIAVGPSVANPDFQAMSFFSGGGLLLTAGLLIARIWLRRSGTSLSANSSLAAVAMRNAGRFPGRSLLTILLLASATFLLISVESFRRRPSQNFASADGGSGGFNLIASVDVPLFHSFTSDLGRNEFLARYKLELQNAKVTPRIGSVDEAKSIIDKIRKAYPLRKRRGDDASCLNLYQAGQPRLLGVQKAMIDNGGFQFYSSLAATDEEKKNPWLLLAKPQEDGAVPVIGEQNSVMYMLKKTLGDTIEMADENGAMKKCRIVATLVDSVFQSELLTSDAAFLGMYPREEGFSEFLISCDPADEADVRAVLEFGLQSHGLLVSRSADRVAAYQAVVGTYLTTFQILGGLGLLLGVLGLAAIVLRGVWDRLGEFALLSAVGYSKAKVRWLVLIENLLLVLIGLGLGVVAAGISVLPHLAMGGQLPWQGLLLLFAGVLSVGALIIMLATRAALRVPILSALRAE